MDQLEAAAKREFEYGQDTVSVEEEEVDVSEV
jgi:hypothetical protein